MTTGWAPVVAVLALLVSAGLHAAGLTGLPDRAPSAALAGGEAGPPPMLGDRFADLAQGTAVPVPTVAADPQQPVRTAMPTPSVPVRVQAARAETIPAPPVLPGSVAAPVVQAAKAEPVPEPVQKSGARKSEPKPKADQRPAGNARETARKGTSDGVAEGRSARAASSEHKRGDGGAAQAASYGRQVMQKIARTRKKPADHRGTAVVGFTVTANGSVAAVRVLRSSGFAALDALALDHIRRAAPFPPPPAGAGTRFSVEFKGRG